MDTFKIGNVELPYFYHEYNCGLKGSKRITERTIEIAIADYWLNNVDVDDVMEIGAVTPYYFPNRIKDVVDPSDTKATIKDSLFNIDPTGKNILSISTIEHFGTGEYGIKEDTNPILALNYIMYNSHRYLITFPWGVSNLLDELILSKDLLARCKVYMFTRFDNEWNQVEVSKLLGYGDNMANSVIVLERGGNFETQPKRY